MTVRPPAAKDSAPSATPASPPTQGASRRARPTRRRALIALAVALPLALLALAGCGGGESGSGDARAEDGKAGTEGKGGGAKGSKGKGGKGGKDGKGTKKGKRAKGSAAGSSQESAEAGSEEKQPSEREKREAINTLAAENVLKLLGLEGRVRVRSRGRDIAITITRATACLAVPDDERRIIARISEAEPSVRRVSVTVQGAGSLAAYVRANCSVQQLPSGPGKVVFSKSGEGFFESRPIKIRAESWTIEYRNEGDSLFVFVFEGDQLRAPAIASQEREVGSTDYTGSGRFRLQIRGGGGWTVRVRAGK